ncbi:MAG: RNA-binding S4 domain-containing protein [Gemmatimonadetes bacterium]|nr:RNA-binding S4 domain-containing protein [Gemmatimonadota bacterium]
MSRIGSRDDAAPTTPTPVRIDKWLWAARFFKTRSQAADAVAGGKVEVGGERVKPARMVRVGEEVRVRLGPYVHIVHVRAMGEKRGPASVAATLYEETADSRAAREKHAWQLKHAAPVMDAGEGRPTKKDRRALDKQRGR